MPPRNSPSKPGALPWTCVRSAKEKTSSLSMSISAIRPLECRRFLRKFRWQFQVTSFTCRNLWLGPRGLHETSGIVRCMVLLRFGYICAREKGNHCQRGHRTHQETSRPRVARGYSGHVQRRRPKYESHWHCHDHDGHNGCPPACSRQRRQSRHHHEPTFYDHLDTSNQLPQGESDAVLAEKRRFIEEHHLVVWRFHDYWHARQPDGILLGVVKQLGWEKYQDATNPHLFTIPETTADKLSEQLQTKLGIHVMRVVADPGLKVKRIALSPGAAGFRREVGALEMPDVELLITGESREWETVEYVADAIAQGRHKALIMLSHVPSEQPGMGECAKWLKTFVTEVPVEFVPTKDPFAPLKSPSK